MIVLMFLEQISLIGVMRNFSNFSRMSIIDSCLFSLADKDNLHHNLSHGIISRVPGTLET